MYSLLFLWMFFTPPGSAGAVEPPLPPRTSPTELERAIIQRQTAALLPIDEQLTMEIASALQESCQEFGVDRKLMLALIYVESTGNPWAVSKVGARGLTQLMPDTAEEIARELGVPWTGPDMLFDVRLNIRFGTYYMSKLLDRFEGKNLHAVASYNWGPNGISRRLRTGQALPTGYANKVLRTRKRLVKL